MMTALTRIAILPVLFFLQACGDVQPGDPEAEIRAWVEMMQAAAEDKDRSTIIEHLSNSYTDARGNTRADIDARLRVYFLRQNSISLLTKIDEISIVADTAAEVSLTVGMAGTNNSAFGISADAYRFELELEHDGDNWLLLSARWGELGSQVR